MQPLLQRWPQEISVALWSDSTYGSLDTSKVQEVAKELGFPLSNFACSYGAGLATKGDETGVRREVAGLVIVEMGYNDEQMPGSNMTVQKMRQQLWFKALSEARAAVKSIVFVRQPSYCQVAGTRKRKCETLARGSTVHGSQLTDAAAQLVRSELGIEVSILDRPADELFAGFTLGQNGEVWQDSATCRSYTSHGVDYDASDRPALWYDARHPSAAGAELHLRRLIAVLQESVWHLCPSLAQSVDGDDGDGDGEFPAKTPTEAN